MRIDELLSKCVTAMLSEMMEGVAAIDSMNEEEKASFLFSMIKELTKSAKNKYGDNNSDNHRYKPKEEEKQNAVAPKWVVFLLYPFYSFVLPEKKERWLTKFFNILKNFTKNTDEEIAKFTKEFQTNKRLFRDTIESALNKHTSSKRSKPNLANISNDKNQPSKLKAILRSILIKPTKLIVSVPVFLYEVIIAVADKLVKKIRDALPNKSPQMLGGEETVGQEQEAALKETREAGLNENGIAHEAGDVRITNTPAGDIGTTTNTSIESSPSARSPSPIKPTNGNDNLLEDGEDIINGQNHGDGETEEENPDVAEQKRKEEADKNSKEPKPNEANEESAEEVAATDEQPSVLTEGESHDQQTHGAGEDGIGDDASNEQLNSDIEPFPEISEFGETDEESWKGIIDEIVDEQEKHSDVSIDDKHAHLADLTGATEDAEELTEKKNKEKDEESSKSPFISM
jgi:hypothetical protein